MSDTYYWFIVNAIGQINTIFKKAAVNMLWAIILINDYLVIIQSCAFAPVLGRCTDKCHVVMTRDTVLLPPVQLHHILTAHFPHPVHQTQRNKPAKRTLVILNFKAHLTFLVCKKSALKETVVESQLKYINDKCRVWISICHTYQRNSPPKRVLRLATDPASRWS